MSLTRILAKRISNYDSPTSVGSKLRAKRIAPLLAMIEGAFTAHGHVNLIDIGGIEPYWGIVPTQYLLDRKVKITIVNLPGSLLAKDHGPFTFAESDGCDLAAFKDRSFHIAHSNSVVEHVGDWGRQLQFARELERVSPASLCKRRITGLPSSLIS